MTIRITILYKLSIKFAKVSASFGDLRLTPRKAIPTKAEKITTPIVLVERVPAKSAKTLLGMKETICCGIDRSWTCVERSANSAIRAVSVAPSVKLAPSRPKTMTITIPIKAAIAVVPSKVARTVKLIFLIFSLSFILVKAPTIETKIKGMISICKRAT